LSWEAIPPDTATFTPDITPLVLAAHRDNYEIIKILLDRGGTLPMPHDVRCGCEECMTSRHEDSLRHSRSRINSYRALASPSLIALSSKDPILTAFELSWELRRLSFAEHEFKSEYMELRAQCQKFATALLDHTRSSTELEILLNHDQTGPVYQHGERMHLNRLKLAIKYRQKKFVAHPNVQQLLASIWYDGLPGFRQMNMILQFLEVCRIGLLFPFFSLAYIICPWASWSQKLRKPFIKFICTSFSYFTFLFLLILASQRIEVYLAEWFENEMLKEYLSADVTTKRGSLPTLIEWCILAWVAGFIWSEIKQLWDVGLREYVNDMWNVVDFVTNALYVATVALRLVAYYRVQAEVAAELPSAYLPREHWDTWDPMLISEGLFAAANIFSNLKLVYIFSVNPYLGPLQVTLSRMVIDILKFVSLFFLVLFSFSCGANQLLWYYADLEKKACHREHGYITTPAPGEAMNETKTYVPPGKIIQQDINHCLAFRRFSNLWETIQTFVWSIFGLIDLDNFELTGIKEFTRFFGLLMFGSFSVINIIVLLNLLIAMMNHSYQLISVSSEKADVEWKFARSKLWISYFEEGGTVPPPFNIIPTPKGFYYLLKWIFVKICGRSSKIKKEFMKTTRVRQASERDLRYHGVMRNLVRRYVTLEQRKAESEGVTEDDVNEIKNDISAFRFELIEIMRQSGMNTTSASMGGGVGGKKNRLKERRLMKGFNIGSNNLGKSNIGGSGGGGVSPNANSGAIGQPVKKCSLTVNTAADIAIDMDARKSPIHRLARLAKMASTQSVSQDHTDHKPSFPTGASASNTTTRKWGRLIQAASGGMIGGGGGASDLKRGSLGGAGAATTPSSTESSFKRLGSTKSSSVLLTAPSMTNNKKSLLSTSSSGQALPPPPSDPFDPIIQVEVPEEEQKLLHDDLQKQSGPPSKNRDSKYCRDRSQGSRASNGSTAGAINFVGQSPSGQASQGTSAATVERPLLNPTVQLNPSGGGGGSCGPEMSSTSESNDRARPNNKLTSGPTPSQSASALGTQGDSTPSLASSSGRPGGVNLMTASSSAKLPGVNKTSGANIRNRSQNNSGWL